MAEKKILTTIIKRLDRVIALLDSSYDIGEMNENTRRRIIEMLHTSISDVYSFGKQGEELTNVESPIFTEEKHDTVIEESTIEKIQVKEDIVATETHDEIQPNIAIAEEEEEEDIAAEPTLEESISIDITEVNIEDNPKTVEEQIDDLIELETISSADYNIDEQPLIEQIKEDDVKITEQELTSVIQDTTITYEEEKIAKEKAQLAELRNQLEEERKRLEEELVSWQKERLKREEEMKAAEQLLSALETETQKRKAAINETIVTPTPIITPPAPMSNQVVVDVPVEPKKTIADINSNNTTTIADKLSKQRQSMQDQSSSDDLKRQGITPISDLTKAIGINDKFQFIKELFGGDSDRYTDSIRMLNNFNNLSDAYSHIDANFNWDKNNEVVKRIILLVRRRYMV